MSAMLAMSTKYGKSPWLDRFPVSRVPAYPRQRGSLQADVAIVGGGLAGCATAYACAAAGIKVVLVEAGQIGRGSTASAFGRIVADPGVSFVDTEKANGLRAARHAFQSWRRAAFDLIALLRRLDVKCDLRPTPTVQIAVTPEQVATLKSEQKARRDAGLDAAPFLTGRAIATELALDAAAAIRDKGGVVVDPYRACAGVAAAAADRGASIFERSPARRITFGSRAVDVFTAAGTIRAGRVVVATGAPTALFRPLERHFWYRTSFLALTHSVPAKIRRDLGRRASVMRDSAEPPHVIQWLDDERLMVAGADSASVPDRQRDKVIVQRTGQLMYELSTLYPAISGIMPAFGWDAAYARSADGLPCIGPHRNFPRHLFAFGDSSRSLTGAYLASRILLRHLLDEVEPADIAFAFMRHGH